MKYGSKAKFKSRLKSVKISSQNCKRQKLENTRAKCKKLLETEKVARNGSCCHKVKFTPGASIVLPPQGFWPKPEQAP